MHRNQYPDMFTSYYDDYYLKAPEEGPSAPAYVPVKPPAPVVQQSPAQTQALSNNQEEPLSVSLLTPPATSSPKIMDSPTPVALAQHPSSDLQRQLASKMFFGMIGDFNIEKKYKKLNEMLGGDYLINGDAYALWQYRQFWLKAGLANITTEHGYGGYNITELSVRIPIGFGKLYLSSQSFPKNKNAQYDLKLESMFKIDSQGIRLQAGYGGLNWDENLDYNPDRDMNYYLSSVPLYKAEFFDVNKLSPGKKYNIGIEIGNHPGMDNADHLPDTILNDLPLARYKKGTYQLTLNVFRLDAEGDDWDQGFETSQRHLSLSFKPLDRLEARVFQKWLDCNKSYGADDYGLEETSAGISVGYILLETNNVNIHGIGEFNHKKFDYYYRWSPNLKGKGTLNTGCLAGIFQYQPSPFFTLHAKLGLRYTHVAYNTDYYYNYNHHYYDHYDTGKLAPTAALGFHLNYEYLFYKD